MSLKVENIIGQFEKKSSLYKRLVLIFTILAIIFLTVNTIFKYRYKILNVILSVKYHIKGGTSYAFNSLESENASFNIFNKKLKVVINANKITPSEKETILNGVKVSFNSNSNKYLVTLFADIAKLFENKDIEIFGNINLVDQDYNKMIFKKIYGNIKSGKIYGDSPNLYGIRGEYEYFINANKMEYMNNDIITFSKNITIEANNKSSNSKTIAQCNKMYIDYIRKIVTLNNRVSLKHDKYNITSNQMIIKLNNIADQKTDKIFSNEVESIYVNGDVSLDDGEVRIFSGKAEYIAKDNSVIFNENVSIVQRGSKIYAYKVIYDIITKEFEIVPRSKIKSLKNVSDSNIEIVVD